jgi:hypothetical protein
MVQTGAAGRQIQDRQATWIDESTARSEAAGRTGILVRELQDPPAKFKKAADKSREGAWSSHYWSTIWGGSHG